MAKRRRLTAEETETSIRGARRSEALANALLALRFTDNDDLIDAPRHQSLARTRMLEMEVWWRKLDMHFRHLPVEGGAAKLHPWENMTDIGHRVASAGTPDMLFHSDQLLMAALIQERNPRLLWSRRDVWYGPGADARTLDYCLTLHLYTIGRVLADRFPDHTSNFTEYGSVPLQQLDHEIPHRSPIRLDRQMLRSRYRLPDSQEPQFPVPVYFAGAVRMVYPTLEAHRASGFHAPQVALRTARR